MNRCAVKYCREHGRPQICPYDHKYHHHGMIHYDCGSPEHSVAFVEGWEFVCNTHYELLKSEREAFETEKTSA